MGVTEDRHRAWRAAGAAAAALVQPGDRVGLGTGRAAGEGILGLGARVREGLTCFGVATSARSVELAREHGIPVGPLTGPLDIAFDGADAVDPRGLMVKGGGGALVRERIVARAAARWIVLVDDPKMVSSLDEWGTLPIAVIPFAAEAVAHRLDDLAPTPRDELSDDALTIIDLSPPAGADWGAVADRAASLAGVVDHGLFRAPLSDVFVGHADGTWSPAG